MATRTSKAVQDANEDATGEGGTGKGNIRYCSIPCGMKRVILKSAECLVPHFKEYSASIGIMRFVVSLVANHVVLSNAHAVEHGNMFLFFTQVWSAVDRYNVRKQEITKKKKGRIEHFDKEVGDFFESRAWSGLPKFAVPVMCRQQECAALKVATCAHLQMFPARLKKYLVAKLVFDAHELEMRVDKVEVVAAKLANIIMSEGELEMEMSKVQQVLVQHPSLSTIQTQVRDIVVSEYNHLNMFRGKYHMERYLIETLLNKACDAGVHIEKVENVAKRLAKFICNKVLKHDKLQEFLDEDLSVLQSSVVHALIENERTSLRESNTFRGNGVVSLTDALMSGLTQGFTAITIGAGSKRSLDERQ